MKKKETSLRTKLLALTVLTLLIMMGVVAINVFFTLRMALDGQSKADILQEADLVESMLGYYGDDDYQAFRGEDGGIVLYRGEMRISPQDELLDSFRRVMNTQISIYSQDILVMTTMGENQGAEYLGSIASPVLVEEVLKADQEKYYSHVDIFGEDSFAVYRPLYNADGTRFGMLGISKGVEYTNRDVRRALVPILLICIFGIVLAEVIVLVYGGKFCMDLMLVKRFMQKVSEGSFSESLPEKLLRRSDELGSLSRNALSMQKSLRNLVEYDPLTQINNRRYANKRLEVVRQRYLEGGSRFQLCICDIDHFKRVNDTYGHDAGDEVLREIAAILKRNMSGKGFPARWGGEEFLLVFEHGRLAESAAALEQILKEIRGTEIVSGGQRICVTMSFGITDCQSGGENAEIEEILKRADELLYYGKESGRNRIITDEDPEEQEKEQELKAGSVAEKAELHEPVPEDIDPFELLERVSRENEDA